MFHSYLSDSATAYRFDDEMNLTYDEVKIPGFSSWSSNQVIQYYTFNLLKPIESLNSVRIVKSQIS